MAAAVLGGAGLAGCGPHVIPRIFVIGDPSRPLPGVRSENGFGLIELKPVALPYYLDSTDILRRSGPNELTPSPSGQWGERLSLGLTDALAAALSQRLPKQVVTTRPAVTPAWRVQVEIERIDIGGGFCVLTARWSILGQERAPLSAWGHATFSEAAATAEDAAVAAAMSRMVDQLAEQIAREF